MDHSPYKGLDPDSIDCIFASNTLPVDIGSATNIQLRYQNYIKPYIKRLQEMGATTYNIPKYGKVVILNNKNNSFTKDYKLELNQ